MCFWNTWPSLSAPSRKPGPSAPLVFQPFSSAPWTHIAQGHPGSLTCPCGLLAPAMPSVVQELRLLLCLVPHPPALIPMCLVTLGNSCRYDMESIDNGGPGSEKSKPLEHSMEDLTKGPSPSVTPQPKTRHLTIKYVTL